MKARLKRYQYYLHKVCAIGSLIYKAKKTHKMPNDCDILIFDSTGSSIVSPCLYGYNLSIMFTRGEEINLRAAIRSMGSSLFWRGRFRLAYFVAYINISQPKLVLTYIDNDPDFYSISTHCNVKTAFIQNGIRSHLYSIFRNKNHPKKRPRVDMMFVHGLNIGKEYNKYLHGCIYPIGSFRSNSVAVAMEGQRDSHSVLFISQYRNHATTRRPMGPLGDNQIAIQYSDFYHAEKIILPIVARWCRKNSKILVIQGVYPSTANHEESAFFNHILSPNKYVLQPNDEFNSGYTQVDRCNLVAHVDSTLGYEAAARGSKVAHLSIRSNFISDKSAVFGWPKSVPNSGLSWTTSPIDLDLSKVLESTFTSTHQEYKRHLKAIQFHHMMASDPMNNMFREVIKKSIMSEFH